METFMTTLILSDYGGDDFDDSADFGGLVAPKSNCPHIASHVKFQVVDGDMMLLLSSLSLDDDCSTNHKFSSNNNNDDDDKGETTTEILRRSHHDFHWLHFNTSTIFTKTASCQHFQCINRHTNNRRTNLDKVWMMMMMEGEDNNNQRDCKINENDKDEGNEEGEGEEDNIMGAVGENWLCLECGLLHCSRYQFGHAKMHYETTKERQLQLQLQKMQRKSDNNIVMAAEEGGGGEDRVVEGHCIAVSMADLSVWCYECNSYLRHPILQEITTHLEGIKFGNSSRSDDDHHHVAHGNNGAEEGEEEDDQEEEEEEAKDKKSALADPMLDGDNKVSLDTTTISSNEFRNHATHRESTLTSSASSSSNKSISKRKGQPPKRRAPETQNHDWSYQKFKPDDGCGKQTSNDRSENTAKYENDHNFLSGGGEDVDEEEEDEEIAALIESQHGEILRAYLARHESFDTSNMGQCVPMHMPRPPSFPTEMADFLRSPLCKSIIVLAGAGMSVSCGIPDFRSVGVGLYDTLQPELLTASAEERELIKSDPALALHKHLFLQNPLPMLETKRSFILGTHEKKWKATLAHRFVELLHTKLGKLTRLYTQNIDGLELQTAIPAKKVVSVHGSMGAAACELCGHKMDFDVFCDKVRSNIKDITGKDGDAPTKSTPIYCEACGEATVKPDIVLFAGSLPKIFYKCTVKDLPEADLLIVMGTSLSVAPANSLVYRVPSTALRLVMNNERVGRRLGIDYSDSAIRDIWAHGSTDASCLDLAEAMGWLDDLALVMDELPVKSARLLRKRLNARMLRMRLEERKVGEDDERVKEEAEEEKFQINEESE